MFKLVMWSLGEEVATGQIVNLSARFREESCNNHINVNSLDVDVGGFDFNNESDGHTDEQIESNLINEFSSPRLQNSH